MFCLLAKNQNIITVGFILCKAFSQCSIKVLVKLFRVLKAEPLVGFKDKALNCIIHSSGAVLQHRFIIS